MAISLRSSPFAVRKLRRSAAALAAFLLVSTAVWAGVVLRSDPVAAGPNDNFTLVKTDDVDGEALIGEAITFTLTASGTQISGANLYNLSFRDVLPVGVDYVSADPAPTAVLDDVPSSGETTVIWENASDLFDGSESSVDLTVDTNPDFAGGTTGSTTVPVGSSFTNTAEAVGSLDPFTIPNWSEVTGAFTGDFDGSASDSHTVDVIPFRVIKTGPDEMLRGVHQNGFDGASGSIGSLYTIVVENNPDYAVDTVTLVDTLDPALEFLGCDTYYPSDNTTVGEEWIGSGPVATGTGCAPTPTSVDTNGSGETVVTWDLGNLTPGQTTTIAYQAGIPLFENEPFSGIAPSAAGLGQGRNLDNNTGPSTGEPDSTAGTDPELLSPGDPPRENTATATGTYIPTGAPGSASDTEITSAEDLRITKSSTGSLVEGSIVTTTLTITTSEYRDFTDLVVRDLLPSGLCFLGTYNSDTTSGGSDWATNDCPGAGTVQSTINGSPVDAARVRELPTGGPYGTGRFEVVWDFADPDNAALADLDADGTITITYSSVVREFYRGGLVQLTGEPVLAGDEVVNAVEVQGPDTVADSSLAADPVDPDGGADGDTAFATVTNGVPTVDKRVSVKSGPLAGGAGTTAATCGTSYGSITWAEGDPTPEPGFGPGDIFCFELSASFVANVSYEGVTIQDILPPVYEYITGSATRITSVDTIPGTTVTETSAVVTFNLGGTGDLSVSGHEFRWVIAARFTDNQDGVANDINANLQKLIYNNNGGDVFQLRDQAEAIWSEPEVRLAKGVDTVNAGSSNGADFDDSLNGGSVAVGVAIGDVVTYRLDVWNEGNVDATSTEVQDVLPSGLTCTDVSSISAGGTCSSGRVTWTGLTVAFSTGVGDSTPDDEDSAPLTLTYDLTLPTSIHPGDTWTNTAGVASYQGVTNTGTPYDYYPADNIDPANTASENTDAADDQAYVSTEAISVQKRLRSGIDEAGNTANASLLTTADEATIGEIVQFEVEVTIPEGTTVYNAEITDTLPSGMTWFTGSGHHAGAVSNLQPSVGSDTGTAALTGGSISHAAGVVTYALPTPYTNAAGSGDDQVHIQFYVQVDDVVANAADPELRLRNRGRFEYEDAVGGAQSAQSNRRDTYIVEPNPTVTKDHTSPSGNIAAPGGTVTYRITVDNAEDHDRVSVAHDVTVVDTVPVGTTPLGVGAVPVATDGDLVPTTGVTPSGSFNGTWSETNRTITWTPADQSALDAMDPDDSVRFTYDVQIDDPASSSESLVNTADIIAYTLDQDLIPTDDPNEDDARSYTDDDTDTIVVPSATLSKDVEPFNAGDPADDIASITVGEPIDYELTVTVPAGTMAFDATVFDDLPSRVDFDSFGTITVGTECEVFDGGLGVTTGTPLASGDVETFNPVDGDASMLAWFLGDLYADGDCEITVAYTVHVNDTATTGQTVVNEADLLWNIGNEVADQAPVALPAAYDDPDDPDWDTGDGPVAETVTVIEPQLEIDKDVATTAGGALANPTCDTTVGNNDGTSDDADGVAGSNGCDTTAGAELRYTVTVTNTGTGPAHDVTVTDVVPAGLTPLASPGGAIVTTDGATVTGSGGAIGIWSETNHTITWTLAGPVAASGGTATVDYDALVDASDDLSRGQDLTNTADIPTYYGLSSVDRTQIVLDNPANDDIITYGNDGSATRGSLTDDDVTVEVFFPTLQIVKTADVGQDSTDVRLDESFDWTLTVTNTDTVASAYNVDVTDALPEGWTYDAASAMVTTPHNGGPVQVEPTCVAAPSGSCATAADLNTETLTWTDLVSGDAEPLGPGQTITIALSATPESAALTPNQTTGETYTGYDGGAGFAHTNNTDVVGEDLSGSTTCCDPDGPGGTDPESYTDDDTDDVYIARADIEVEKTVSPVEADADPTNGPYWFGSYIEYTVTARNQGPDEATGVTLSDVLDVSGLSYDSVVSASQGSFSDTTNIWTVGTMADGAVETLVLRTRLVGIGPITNVAQNETTDQYDSDSDPGNDVPSEDDQASVTVEAVPTSLGDTVWLDLDEDGVQDTGEPGIPNVEIDLTWADPATGGTMTYSVTTDSDGNYSVPAAASLPADTNIIVTVDAANSPNLTGMGPTFDRDSALGSADGTSTQQITTADTTLSDGTLADLDFDYGYNFSTGQTLGDKIWWDDDNSADGSNGAGENGLPDITVTATWAGWDGVIGTADDLDFTTDTDADGDYLFTGIPPGDYRVTVDTGDLPAGLDTQTYDLDGTSSAGSADITLDPSENQLDVDFSYRGVGRIGDTVWFDHNGDGVIDSGEPGIGGVTVTLSWDGPDDIAGNGDDQTVTTTTAADGTYSFENLPDGDFTVTVDDSTLPDNMAQTYDDDGTGTAHTSGVTLSPTDREDLDQDFGYRGTGSIGDTVFYDVDGTETDGSLDTGDSPIPAVDVTVLWAGVDGVFGTADDFTYTDTTDGSGNYLVDDLPAGEYRVTVDTGDLPAGLTSATYDDDGTGTDSTSDTTLTLAAPDDLDQDFSYTGATSGIIGDTIWFDHNGDGVQDSGEVGFSGVTVTLTWYGADGVPGGGDDVVQTTTTDADGEYLFDNLPEGNFEVVVDDTTLPSGLTQTYDDDGVGTANTSLVTLSTGMLFDRDQDFGYRGVGSIGDTVWYDIDDSGTATADSGEPGIPGVDVEIVWTNPQGSDMTFTVTTDADGEYLVPDLPHGDYTVTVQTGTLPEGMTQTYDDDGTGTADTSSTTLSALTPDDLDQDFSYTGVGSIGDTIWFDQDADGASDPAGTGVFDGQDQPLDDIDVTITWGGFDGVIGDDPGTVGVDESADDLTYSATTDADGEYLVGDLPYGPYRVDVDTADLPSGITEPTFDDDGTTTASTSSTTLDATTPNDLDQDFSYTGAGSVGDTVWFDLDGDGELDADEVGLSGITVTLIYTGPDGTTVTVSVDTDSNGNYGFDNLPLDVPLTITIDDADLPSGMVPTHDDDVTTTAHTSIVTLTSAEPDNVDQDFGYRGEGSIGDTIWLDRDNSGTATVDTGGASPDVLLPNVDVTITWTNPTGGPDLSTTVTTDSDGRYLLEGLPHGDYTVTVDPATLPDGVDPTYDDDGITTASTSSTTLDAVTPDDLDHDFSYSGSGSLGDTVWQDVDADGVFDTDEQPIAGVPVTITWNDPVTGVTFSEPVNTDADGTYDFALLPAGEYEIVIDSTSLPVGYQPTHDLDGVGTDSTHRTTTTLAPAESLDTVDFGYRPEADLSVVKSTAGDFTVEAENTWTLTVRNDGPAAAAEPVRVIDTLPEGVTVTGTVADDWDCTVSGRTVDCVYTGTGTGTTPISMAPNTTSTIDIGLTVPVEVVPTVTNTATVSSPTTDVDPDDNTDTDTVDVPLSVLDLEKTLSSQTLVRGEDATYRIVVTNHGPSPTRGDVEIVDDLPDGLRFKSATLVDGPSDACTGSSGTVRCTVAAVMAVDASVTIEVVAEVTASAGTNLVNNASVAGGNEVNGFALPILTLETIYLDLADPAVSLGQDIGIGTIEPAITDQAAAEVPPDSLAYSGGNLAYGVTTGLTMLLAGVLLVLGVRNRRRSIA